jgi:pyrroloquinoline quinone (PQQ) biosynthesis protein C
MNYASQLPVPQLVGRIADPLVALVAEAESHVAIHHPWLTALAAGTLPDPAWAVRDFAVAYHGYSQWFPRYLETVIRRLPDARHRALLAENLAEEKGELHEEDRQALMQVGIDPAQVEGIPHSRLFRDFCSALGVGAHELETPRAAAIQWRQDFLRALEQGSPAFCVGALGLGTEGVVKPIYRQLLAGIRRAVPLPRPDYVFFELHCLVDDQHQKDLLMIAQVLAATPAGQADLRAGMLAALDLRAGFWDYLHGRAMRRSQCA